MPYYNADGVYQYLESDLLPEQEFSELLNAGLLALFDLLKDGTPGSVTEALLKKLAVQRKESFLDPRDFGAKGDGRKLDALVLTLDQNTVYRPATFTPADIGRRIVVQPLPGSSKPPFSATITGLTGGGTGELRNGAVTDKTWTEGSVAGATGYVATDDSLALQAWLDDDSDLTRWLPGRFFGFAANLIHRGRYSLQGSSAGGLVAVGDPGAPTDRPAGARSVSTALSTSHRKLNLPGVFIADLSIDCNLLFDDGIALQWVRGFNVNRVKVSGQRRRGFTQGEPYVGPVGADLSDPAQRSTSYETKWLDCETKREYGVVPRYPNSSSWEDPNTVFKRPQGDAAMSVGFYFDYNCTDSTIGGKTVAMGDQIGFQFHAGNTQVNGAHGWARGAIGKMDVAFNIISDNVVLNSTYGDTAELAAYWHQGRMGEFYNAKVYNNAFGSNDKSFGWVLTYAHSPLHVWDNCHLRGADAAHTIRGDIGRIDGTYVELPEIGAYNLRGHVVEQFVNQYHLSAERIARPLVKTETYVVTATDSGAVIEVNSAVGVNVTMPLGLPAGFTVDVLQVGDGQVTINAVVGAGIAGPAGHLPATRAKGSRITVRRRVGGVTYAVSGDCAGARYFTAASFTVTQGNTSGTIVYESANAGTITLNAGSLQIGQHVRIEQAGVGQATVTGDGVSIVAPDARVKTRTRYSTITVYRRAGGDYIVSGDASA